MKTTTPTDLTPAAREILSELGITCRLLDDGTVDHIGDASGGRYDDPTPTLADIEAACAAVADASTFRDTAQRFDLWHVALYEGR